MDATQDIEYQESLVFFANDDSTTLFPTFVAVMRLASEGNYDDSRTLAQSLLFLLHFVLADRFPHLYGFGHL